MNGIYLSADEIEALRDASHLAFRVYCALRQRMDIATCTAGQVRHISHQLLREETEYHIRRGAGWQRVQASIKEIRVALDSLVRGGLLERLSADAPVFRMPLAEEAKRRAKNTGPRHGIEQPAKTPRKSNTCTNTRPPTPAKPGTHLRSENKTSLIATASPESPPVDNSIRIQNAAADLLKTIEGQIGYPIWTQPNDARAAQWISEGVSIDAIAKAAHEARQARLRDHNTAPLNSGYIAAFLRRQAPTDTDWRQSWTGIVTHGQRLGLTQHPGEPCPTFKARVMHAAGDQP